jgi:uncharacterized protein
LNVLIVGASVRAAAHSALRAGWQPTCGDLFADRDLAAVCDAHRIPIAEYPARIEALADRVAPAPWFYTGALENHSELVDRVAQRRTLWGNAGSVLRAARDPLAVSKVLRQAGLPCPEVRLDARGLPRDGGWLVKPLDSAGGRGIRPLGPGTSTPDRASYFQQRIEGTPLSAVMLGDGANSQLLGVTWQWVGRPGAEFAYKGSVGPWPLSSAEQSRIARLGRALASAFKLRGLFGIDLILKDGEPWPVEINPRYTASIEVLELALGRSLLAEHGRVFDPGLPEPPSSSKIAPERAPRLVSKAVLFARKPCVFEDPAIVPLYPADWFDTPRLADIPHSGERFEVGEPVLTVFARAGTIAACRARLERLLVTWRARIGC